MAVKFVDKHMRDFMSILEAAEGDFLACGRTVSGGAVFDKFSDALVCMNAELESNRKAFRKVRSAVIVEYEGKVSCGVHVTDNDDRRPS